MFFCLANKSALKKFKDFCYNSGKVWIRKKGDKVKFLHTADWHLGKKLHGYDLFEEQKFILEKMIALAKKEKVDAFVIAGDIYDRGVPPENSVALYNQLVEEINLKNQLPLLVISGNHDSGVRLGVGAPWFESANYFLNTQLANSFEPVVIKDTAFYLLPYFEPVDARIYFSDDSLRTIQAAMPKVLNKIIDSFVPGRKNILVSHFFVSGSQKSDSETKLEIGGLDGIPAELLAPFDYVALGHLHNKNALQLKNARYSGSPLKYSLSEKKQEKGAFLVETSPDLIFNFQPLVPQHEVKEITASFQDLLSPAFYEGFQREDFLAILLEDRGVIPNLMNQLRPIYPRILQVERLQGRENQNVTHEKIKALQQKSPLQLTEDFFAEVTQEELTSRQQQWIEKELHKALKERRD